MDYSILVNKEHPLDKDFKVEELVAVGKHFGLSKLEYSNDDVLLEKTTAKQIKKLLTKANKVDKAVYVIPNSGYRSIEYQIKVMNYYIGIEGEEKARKRVAEPGTSEHHTGLSIDLTFFKDGEYIKDLKLAQATADYINKNAHKYGFILRYPKGKEEITGYPNEPWHFRYVGEKLATHLYKNSLTLEEYYMIKEKNV